MIEVSKDFYLHGLQPGDEVWASGKFCSSRYKGIFQEFFRENDDLKLRIKAFSVSDYDWKNNKWGEEENIDEIQELGTIGWLFYCRSRDIDGMRTVLTLWYNCAHCDAGYPDQECTCKENEE